VESFAAAELLKKMICQIYSSLDEWKGVGGDKIKQMSAAEA